MFKFGIEEEEAKAAEGKEGNFHSYEIHKQQVFPSGIDKGG